MNADQIIARVRRHAYIPTTTAFTDQMILDAVNSEAKLSLTPILLRASGELLTETVDIPLVANQQNYDVPQRSAFSTVRQVTWVDSGGYERPNLVRIEISQGFRFSQTQGDPIAFNLSATQIVLFPTPTSNGGSLRIRYSHKLGTLVSDTKNPASQSMAVGHVLTKGTAIYYLGGVKFTFATNTWPYSGMDPWTGIPLPEALGTPAIVDVVSANSPHELRCAGLFCSPIGVNQNPNPSLIQLSISGVGNIVQVVGPLVACSNNLAGTAFALGPFPLAVDIFKDGDTGNLSAVANVLQCNFDGAQWNLVMDQDVSAKASPGYTIWPRAGLTDVSTVIQSGDFITLAGNTYVPMCPEEWHEVLCLYGAAHMALLRKDFGLRTQLLEQALALGKEMINVSQPRTKQNSKGINAWAGLHRSRYRI